MSNHNWHHRREKQHGGTSRKPRGNLIRVPIKHHEAYNLLFARDRTPIGVAKSLTDIWIDPEWVMIAVPRKKVTKLKQILKELDNGQT